MFDNAGRVMFTALHAAAEARLGPDHPCTRALATAARTPEPEAVRAAESLLRALPDTDRTALMQAAHQALRTDPAAWLAVWPDGKRGH
ncbi:MAG: hypothetical protein QM699_08080 [Amaricoccus sp.]|uniref:hypothetical protein n=1 Tax=Amaricoccus sp. TaxID=1872485 RepID=UPI0039E33E9C